ncbi:MULTISPECIES: DUF58 domain-containing protein [Terrabacter]|jgi:uncharacterized protein (DUF58 family)|uniref:Membrane protein n=1 Tax=Terrabacter tumescens TaxID=60443 RepID=A0ABQ2I7Y0_9MICO|nr:DUF58 domain-containing protein [Terrabacter tumescens]WVM94901.1 DUF58 domain-containing protein [Terrabacter sp. C0L_2]GGN02019.1 membrane protein [Terrabacter tumescens]
MRSLWSVLTTRGRAFMGSGAVLVLAGVIFGFRDLTRFGVLLVALPIISAVLVRTRKTRMRIERHTHPERISVGQDAHVTLSFENVSSATTPIFLAEERLDYVLGDRPRFVVGRIPSGRVRAIDYAVRSHLRGRHHLGPLGVQVQDPFGLANRNAVLEGTADLIVLPAVHPLSSNRQPSAGVGSEGEQAQLISLHGEDDVTIREYRDGDDLRRIHWPATARTGDLMVRQEDRPAQRRAVVIIDPRPSAHGGTGASSSFEWAVTAAASVAVHLCDSGYAVHLVCAETVETSRAAETMTPDEILDVLAVATTRDDTGEDEILRAGQALASAGGFLVAIVGPSGRDVTSRVASLRQPGTTGLALVLDARSFGTTDAEEAEPHVDALRLAGWRAVAVQRDEDVAHAWAVLTAATVGGSR